MTAFIGLMWAKHGGAILIVLGIVFLVSAIYGVGYFSGRNDGKVDQLQDSVKAYEKREGIDNDTNALGRDAVCRRLGGLPDQCNQLRRMEEATADQ